MDEAINLKVLEKQLKFAWTQVTSDILDNICLGGAVVRTFEHQDLVQGF